MTVVVRSLFRQATGGLLIAALLNGFVACTAGDEADLKPPPGYIAPPFRPPRAVVVRFGAGFYRLESGPDGKTWRWTAKRGRVLLVNDRHDKRLHLAGRAPLELLTCAPTVTIALNGVELDRFTAVDPHFSRTYSVPATRLGAASAADLTIETTMTAHAAGDSRELGISIEALDWEDDPATAPPGEAGKKASLARR